MAIPVGQAVGSSVRRARDSLLGWLMMRCPTSWSVGLIQRRAAARGAPRGIRCGRTEFPMGLLRATCCRRAGRKRERRIRANRETATRTACVREVEFVGEGFRGEGRSHACAFVEAAASTLFLIVANVGIVGLVTCPDRSVEPGQGEANGAYRAVAHRALRWRAIRSGGAAPRVGERIASPGAALSVSDSGECTVARLVAPCFRY